ncbi:uncharacterized protein LOC121389408 isoform X4 [Gigantopelta aegis]|uniref:uncharacterized protein LOC121389408 isoform X4 n=1 Tax=Gigantopelta aegis TaxID=1735272 RepID=UPI001B888FE6|nr:uncharacterized protein LOC121389408 isoform X4 [Gigantopelta aegis]
MKNLSTMNLLKITRIRQITVLVLLIIPKHVQGAQLTVTFGNGDMTITCRPGDDVSQIYSISVITVLRDVSDSRTSKPMTMAAAAPQKYNGNVFLTDTLLAPRATVTGKANDTDIKGSFVQLVFREVTYSDSGLYICEIVFLEQDLDSRTIRDRKNITVPSAQLTVTFGNGDMTITCRPGDDVSQIYSISVITVLRDVSDSRTSKPMTMAAAAPQKYNGNVFLTDTLLAPRATVTGKANDTDIKGSFVQLVFREVTDSDSGLYICEIVFLDQDLAPSTIRDRKNITVPIEGAQLTVTFGNGDMTITCRPGDDVSQIYSISVISVLRDVSDSRTSKPMTMAAAAPQKYNGNVFLTDTLLAPRATVTGKANDTDIKGSFVQLVFGEVTDSDSGLYICEIVFLDQDLAPRTIRDRKNITVPTRALTQLEVISFNTTFCSTPDSLIACKVTC